jgi:hypothetical protein
MLRPIARRLAAPAAALALLAAAPPALADLAFTAPRDVPLAVDVDTVIPQGLAVIGPGAATDPVTGEPVPVQRVAVIAGYPPVVRVVALGRAGPVGAPSEAPLPAGGSPTALTAADLDGDGRRELVVASEPTDTLSVFTVPDAPGPLSTRADFSVGPPQAGPGLGAVTAADLDGDGHLDLVTPRGYGLEPDDGFVLLAGDGAGGLAAPVLVATAAAVGGFGGGGPILAGDVNGDGRTDLLLGGLILGVKPELTSGLLRTFAAAAGGAFVPIGSVFDGSIVFGRLDRVRLRDVDGDGAPDVVFHRDTAAVIRFGDGAGGFGPELPLPPPAPIVTGLTVGDVDADGRPDLLVPSRVPQGPARLNIRRNLGGRTFADPVELALSGEANFVEPLDLNADGAPDLVLGHGTRPDTIAIAYAVPALAGGPLDFGARVMGEGGAPRQVEVTNTGVAPARIASSALSGAAAGDFALLGDGCSGRTLAAGERCPLIVGFTPGAAGARAAAVRLIAQDGAVGEVALTGTATAAPTPPTPVTTPALPSVRASCPLRPVPAGARIVCAVRFDADAAVRVALRLVRNGRAHARADVRRPGRASLRALRPLRAGRYTLVIVASDGTRSRQIRRAVVVRAR